MPSPEPAAVATPEQITAVLADLGHDPGDGTWTPNDIEAVENVAVAADNCGLEWMTGIAVWDVSYSDSEECLITYDVPGGALRLSSLAIKFKYFTSPPEASSEDAVYAVLAQIKEARDTLSAALDAWIAAARP